MVIEVPVITFAEITPNPVDTGQNYVITVRAEMQQIVLEPEIIYSGEIYSGEV